MIKSQKNTLVLGYGGQKLVMGHLGLKPKDLSSYKSRTLAPIFTNMDLFYPESQVEFKQIIKS